MRHFTFSAVLAAAIVASPAASAIPTWYEFSFTGADLMSRAYADGADGTSAADNSLFDGARLARIPGDFARTYVQSQHTAFDTWASTTPHRMTSINFWGFDGRGAGWGEDFKHMDREMLASPADWIDWTTGWVPGWGANPNPFTDVTAGWYVGDANDGLGFGDVDLATKEFSFRLLLDEDDWRYGAATNGAPNALGGDITMWFGGWMGDAANPYQYIYEGNLVLSSVAVPAPLTLALFGFGLAAIGFTRRAR